MSLTFLDPPSPRLVVSKKTAAAAIDVSLDVIKDLVARGELDQVQVSPRRVGITWASLLRLVGRGAR